MSGIKTGGDANPKKAVTESANAWGLGGNTIGTDSNKLGTLDNKDVEIITNNIVRFIVQASEGWLVTPNGSVALDPLQGTLFLQNLFGAATGSISFNTDSGATGGAGGSISATGGLDLANQNIIFTRDGRVVFNAKQFFETNGNIKFTESNFLDAWFDYNNTTKELKLGSNTVDVLLPALPNLSSLATDAQGKIIAGSGGGGSVQTLTKAQLDTAITNSTLTPGAYYFITGVDAALYGGTTVLLQATSTNTLGSVGYGLFYTPKYTGAGNGIWDGTNTYAIGDTAFWGGYVWENLTGNVGSSVDDFELDNVNWQKIAYNTTDYNVWWDVIKYSYTDDWITYRADNFGNVVDGVQFGIEDFANSPIKVFMWGGINTYCKQTNAYINILNIKGYCTSFTLGKYSYCTSFTLGKYSYCIDFTLGNNSYCQAFTLGVLSVCNSFTLGNNSYFQNFTLGDGSSFQNITLGNSSYCNTFTLGNNSYFQNFTLGDGSGFQNFTLGNGSACNSFTLGNNSYFQNFTLGDNSSCSSFTLGDGSGLFNLTLGNSSNFDTLIVYDSIVSNICIGNFSTFYYLNVDTGITILSLNIGNYCNVDFNNTGLITQSMQNLTIQNDCTVNTNISAATTIYQSFAKTIFARQDGTPRLSYYNNSDVQVIVDVDN